MAVQALALGPLLIALSGIVAAEIPLYKSSCLVPLQNRLMRSSTAPVARAMIKAFGSVATAIEEARLFGQLGRLALSNAQQCGKYPGLPG
jgi:hypothetical protein